MKTDDGPEITKVGHFRVARHPNYGGRVKLMCLFCPGEHYVSESGLDQAMTEHDQTRNHQ